MTIGNLLFIEPFAGLWRHSQIQTRLARHLSSSGQRVIILQCDSVGLNSCSYYYYRKHGSAKSLTQNNCCKECLIRSSGRFRVLSSPNLSFRNMSPFSDLWHSVEFENEGRELLNWEWRGMPVGKFAAYDVSLNWKTHPYEAIKIDKQRFLDDLRNSIVILENVVKLAEEVNLDAIVLHNGLYSSNRATWEWAKQKRIPILDIRNVANQKYRDNRYTVFDTLSEKFYPRIADFWEIRREIALNRNQCQETFDYILSHLRNRTPFSYSSSISKSLNNRKDSKVGSRGSVLVIFNSLDERRTAQFCGLNLDERYVFVNELIEFCLKIAKRCKDIDFVFRLHPRMYANHRDQIESIDVKETDRLLSDVPKNVFVDKARQNTNSIYDLAERAHLILSFGSSAGLILSAIGHKVVLGASEFDWWNPREIYAKSINGLEVEEMAQYLESQFKENNTNFSRKHQIYALRFLFFSQFSLSTDEGIGNIVSTFKDVNHKNIRNVWTNLSKSNPFRIITDLFCHFIKDLRKVNCFRSVRIYLNTILTVSNNSNFIKDGFLENLANNNWQNPLEALLNCNQTGEANSVNGNDELELIELINREIF